MDDTILFILATMSEVLYTARKTHEALYQATNVYKLMFTSNRYK